MSRAGYIVLSAAVCSSEGLALMFAAAMMAAAEIIIMAEMVGYTINKTRTQREEEMNDILQTKCPECGHECWRKKNDNDWIYCPECGARLTTQGSEGENDGQFKEQE